MTTGFDQADRHVLSVFTGHRPWMLHNCRWMTSDLRCKTRSRRLSKPVINGFTAGWRWEAISWQENWSYLYGNSFRGSGWSVSAPFPGQTDNWPEEWQVRYQRLLDKADQQIVLIPSAVSGGYLVRDRYMVDLCSLLIGVYNGAPRGGTAYTVRYARSQGLKVRLFAPGAYRF